MLHLPKWLPQFLYHSASFPRNDIWFRKTRTPLLAASKANWSLEFESSEVKSTPLISSPKRGVMWLT